LLGAIARAVPTELHLRRVNALLGGAELGLGRPVQALETSRRGLGLFPRDAELRFREGVMLQALGRLEEARQAYLGLLSKTEERHFASVRRSLAGYKAHSNLTVVAAEMGDLAEAERWCREVVREVPRFWRDWRSLGDILVRGGRFAEAERLAEELLKDRARRIEGLLIKCRTALARQQFAEAHDALDRAVTESPDDLETLCARGQFFFEHSAPDEADRALKSLIEHRPQARRPTTTWVRFCCSPGATTGRCRRTGRRCATGRTTPPLTFSSVMPSRRAAGSPRP